MPENCIAAKQAHAAKLPKNVWKWSDFYTHKDIKILFLLLNFCHISGGPFFILPCDFSRKFLHHRAFQGSPRSWTITLRSPHVFVLKIMSSHFGFVDESEPTTRKYSSHVSSRGWSWSVDCALSRRGEFSQDMFWTMSCNSLSLAVITIIKQLNTLAIAPYQFASPLFGNSGMNFCVKTRTLLSISLA